MTALGNVMREVNAAIGEMLGEHDPLASHIFVSRRRYKNLSDTKSCPEVRRTRAVNDITCRRGSLGSRRAILGFAGTSKSGSGFWGGSKARLGPKH